MLTAMMVWLGTNVWMMASMGIVTVVAVVMGGVEHNNNHRGSGGYGCFGVVDTTAAAIECNGNSSSEREHDGRRWFQ